MGGKEATNINQGKYTQLNRIGGGSFSEVYSCTQTNTNKKIAIKKSRCYNQNAIKQALNEYKIIYQLDHTNVIKILEFFTEKNDFFGEITCLTMELGQTSLNKLFQNQLTHNTIASYITQIVDGLYYLHSNKIVHLDLKPQNIIVFNEGEILKISDFGTSRYLEKEMELTQTHTLGSLSYMSPERKEYVKDFCVDIWSLGIIIYELCRNQRIYKMFGSNTENFRKKITQNQLTGEYQKYNQLILQCLKVNAKARIKIEDVKKLLNPKQKKYIIRKVIPPIQIPNQLQEQKQFKVANKFQQSQKYDEAISEYTKIIDKDSKSIHALKNRALLYETTKSFQLAEKDYTKIIDLKQEDPKIYNQRGKCKMQCEKYKQAQEDYRKAIKLNPNLIEAYQNLGLLYEQQGQLKEALIKFKICIEHSKDLKGQYYQNVARVQNKLKKSEIYN